MFVNSLQSRTHETVVVALPAVWQLCRLCYKRYLQFLYVLMCSSSLWLNCITLGFPRTTDWACWLHGSIDVHCHEASVHRLKLRKRPKVIVKIGEVTTATWELLSGTYSCQQKRTKDARQNLLKSVYFILAIYLWDLVRERQTPWHASRIDMSMRTPQILPRRSGRTDSSWKLPCFMKQLGRHFPWICCIVQNSTCKISPELSVNLVLRRDLLRSAGLRPSHHPVPVDESFITGDTSS